VSSYDVIVIGAGTWGGSTAWHLAERGQRVLAIDAFRPPHEHGSHGGATRLVRQSNSTGPEYVQLTLEAFELWDRIAARTGEEVMVETGNVFVGAPGSRWFDNTLANLEASPFEHEIFETAEARRRFPRLGIGEGELAVWEPRGSVGQVPAALRAMQRLAVEAGAEFRFDEPVVDWSAEASGVTVRTAQGTYLADRLIVTAGAFSNQLLGLDLPTSVERQVLANFAVDPGAPRLPSMYFAAPPGDDSAPSYGCPEPDGTFKFSVVGKGDVITPQDLSQDVTPTDLERVVAVLRDRVPEITGEPLRTTVCMWTEATDGHWLIGRYPDSDRVTYGAACNGRGFRYAPVIGQVLADLSEGTARPELARFEPTRFEVAPVTA
jgi:sarcosine oxidase